MELTHFQLEIEQGIARLAFNRPDKANALHMPAWKEMKAAFEYLHTHPQVRVVILGGQGKHFCAGIDLETLMSLQAFQQMDCEARKREALRDFILVLQSAINAIEHCRKPVLAAVHRACLGGGLDIAAACDMRYCTDDAYFAVKEIDLGLVADLGSLQRLPTILGPGMVAEMAYTGRKVHGPEAEKIGLVNNSFATAEAMMDHVTNIASQIASKSPLVVRGTKEMLLYKRDHGVHDSLDYMATWNAAMFFSKDLQEAFAASMEKRQPQFDQ
ncbi:MAG: crotonase/enoyl-CoA hydratase family protein [Bacteroidota bacterium]